MSAMAIVALSILVSVSLAAELEPLEDGCLLQKANERQLLVEDDPPIIIPAPVSGYQITCGPGCRCGIFGPLVEEAKTAAACAASCSTSVGFTFRPDQNNCRCCNNLGRVDNQLPKQWWLYAPIPQAAPPATALGDPHITTLDGMRYTLLSQGTFSLWHFRGREMGEMDDWHDELATKAQVDWHVYAHYSGQQSFTKGLLLIDKSGGSIRQVLEITSQDCKWKARKGNEDWKVVDNAELIFVPDGKDFVTGFDLGTVSSPRGHGGRAFPNRVHFSMNTKNGKLDVAVMSLSCRPSHNINLQISMSRQRDKKFVDGELKAARKSLSTLQTSTDSEFSVDSKWQELGGSGQAASYFQAVDTVDTHQTEKHSLLQSGCSDADKGRAKETCSKHLGEGTENAHFFEDCIYDVCHGAGETQAELAAELLAVTKAD